MKPEARILLRRLTSNNLHETVESHLTVGNMKVLRDQLKAFESKGNVSVRNLFYFYICFEILCVQLNAFMTKGNSSERLILFF